VSSEEDSRTGVGGDGMHNALCRGVCVAERADTGQQGDRPRRFSCSRQPGIDAMERDGSHGEQEPEVPAEAFAFDEKNSTILKLVQIGRWLVLALGWGGRPVKIASPLA
jgi:hypothetical protein